MKLILDFLKWALVAGILLAITVWLIMRRGPKERIHVRLRGRDYYPWLHENSKWLALLERVSDWLNTLGRKFSWLAFLKDVDLDVLAQNVGWHIHLEGDLPSTPQNILFHELGHLDRFEGAPHIPLPILDDVTRGITMYFDYFRKPKEDEDEADPLEWRWNGNAFPSEAWIDPEVLDRAAPSQPRRAA